MTLLNDHWLFASLLALVLLVIFRVLRAHRIDERFGIKRSGGRGGTFSMVLPTFTVRAEYEVGSGVDLIVYGSSLVNSDGEPLSPEQRTEAIAWLQAWSSARRLSVDIAG